MFSLHGGHLTNAMYHHEETQSFFRLYYYQIEYKVDTLCAQLHLQFYGDSFETIQVVGSWSGGVHVFWIFFDTFSQVELNHFQALITIKVNRYWVLCVKTTTPKMTLQ